MFVEKSLDYKSPFGTYLLGSLIVIFLSFIGSLPLTVIAIYETPNPLVNDPMDALNSMDSNLRLALVLVSFVFSFLALWLVIRTLHKRSLKSIVTSRKKIDWSRVFFAFVIWGGLTTVLVFTDYFLNPEGFQWNFKPIPFLILFGIATLLIPIQTSTEELVFRGYLMQGFGRLFRNRWIPLLLTSLIFGSLHIANPEVGKLGMGVMFYYIGTGLFLGVLTLMDEGTELALGFHAANNLIGALLVTADWTAFQTESVFIDVSEPSLTLELMVSLFVFYPLLLLVFANKYGWKDWYYKLTKKL